LIGSNKFIVSFLRKLKQFLIS